MFEKQTKYVFEKFRGLFDRGRDEACPLEYMLESDNMIFQQDSMKIRRGQFQMGYHAGDGSFGQNHLVDVFKVADTTAPPGSDNFLASIFNGGVGKLYYTRFSYTIPILTINGWNGEFSAVQIFRRVFIMPLDGATPMHVWEVGNTVARLAGGIPKPPIPGSGPGGQLILTPIPLNATDAVGISAGFRIVALVFETNTGYITNFINNVGINVPGGPVFDGTKAASVSNITIGEPEVVKRHLISTKVFTAPWDGNIYSPEYFFIPGGTVPDNTTTTIPYLNWIDSGLVDSADDYIDQMPRIENARRLTLYNGRLIVVAPKSDRSVILISRIGEPESFDAINSILVSEPRSARGIEDVSEHRGNLYLFNDNSTQVTQDDDTNPNEWRVMTVDKSRGIAVGNNAFRPSIAIGQYNHQSVAIGGQLICYSNGGLHTFDGSFREELTWAIREKVEFFPHPTVIVNPTSKLIAFGDPRVAMYVGDYAEGLTAASIKWGKISLIPYGSDWKPGGLYSIYGDGSNIIVCSWNRIFGWNIHTGQLYDTALGSGGQELLIGYVRMKIRLPYIYPNDGWVYQWNEIVSRVETVNSTSGSITITLNSLDDFRTLNAGSIPVTSERGQLQRKWFNFKSEACSIVMEHIPTNIAIGADFKNVSLSYAPLWAKRPRTSTSAL